MLTNLLRKVAEGADAAANWFQRLDPQEQYLVMVAAAYLIVWLYGNASRHLRGRSYRQGIEDGKRMQQTDARKAFEEYLRKREELKPEDAGPWEVPPAKQADAEE